MVPSKNCDFSKNCEKLKKSQELEEVEGCPAKTAISAISTIYLWICPTLICQGISVKVVVTAYSDPQHFAVMTLYKIYSRSTKQSSRFLRSCRTLDPLK